MRISQNAEPAADRLPLYLAAAVVGLLAAQLSTRASAADADAGSNPGPRIEEAFVFDAPVAAVWKAFTEKEALEGWMAAQVEIDLKVGGTVEAHYDPAGEIGDANTIVNTVLAFDPGRMLSLKIEKAPAGFPFSEVLKKTWSVFYLEPVEGGAKTRVRTVALGFGEDEGSKQMMAFFQQANSMSMAKLKGYLERQR